VELIEAVVAMIDALDVEQIDYIVVGSLSSNYYGIPRSTQDGDLVLQLPPGGLAKVRERLRNVFRFDPQTTFESVTGTMCNRAYVPETDYMLELFRLSQDAHDQERFRRRIQVLYLDRKVWLPTAEDVIITKLRWAVSQHRPKDLTDVREVMAVQKGNLDLDYLERWTNEHGSRSWFDDMQKSIAQL
jgi:hypothetical protein